MAVWIFGFLTFLTVLFTMDAFLSLTFGGKSSLLELYPFNVIKNIFGNIDTATYFWISLISAFAFFGFTCLVAFQDPLSAILDKILSEAAKTEDSQVDQSNLEPGIGVLEMINHTLTSNSITLHAVKEGFNSIKDSLNSMKMDLTRLTTRLEKLERMEIDVIKARKCPSCGKDLLPEFKFCPFCGEKMATKYTYPQIYENK